MAFPVNPSNNQLFTTLDGRDYIYDSSYNTWSYRGFDGYAPTSNFNALIYPTNADSMPIYSVGSLWVVNNDEVFICIDDTANTAVWRKFGVNVAATAPSNPAVGDIYLSNVNDITYIWDGVNWIDTTGATSIQNKYYAINDALSTNPSPSNDASQGYSVGSIWFNGLTNQLFMCTDSTNSTAIWLPISGKKFNNVTTDPITLKKGDVWYNTTTNTFKCFDGTTKTFVVA